VKIARIIYEWPPPWQGLAPAPYELTRAQSNLGHQFEIFSANWPNAGDPVQLNNVNLHTVWREPLPGTISVTSSLMLLFNYLKWRKFHKVDLIHSHGHFALWIYFYRRMLQKYFPWIKELETPLVVHFHNTVKGRRLKLEENEANIKTISRYLSWPLAEYADRLAIRSAAAYIFVSEDLKQEAIKHYKADPKKCFVIESGVNPDLFKQVGPEEKAKSRIEMRLAPHDKIIANIGAMVERKNIHLLIEALPHLPKNYKLLLLGDGDEEYKGRLDALIMEKQVKERVIKVGYTPYPQVPIAYQVADLFVLPSSFEGLPKAVMESLSCGTPVLAAGFNLQEDILGLEYLLNLEPKQIAEQIEDMIQNPRQVDRYKIMKNYSWEVKAQQVEEVYHYVQETYFK
jgi:glycosyltransferase involved in cell wall biosynthesis